MSRRTLTTLLTLIAAAGSLPALACPPKGCHGPAYLPPQQVYSPAPAYPISRPVYLSEQPTYTPTPQPVYASTAAATARASALVRQSKAVTDQAAAVTQVRTWATQAKAAFAARNYGTALDLMNKVVAKAPKNSEALEFRSMIRFALADYKAAAADAYESLKYGPVWNATAIKSLYGDMAVYERHLKDLRDAAAAQPESLETHFLLAQQMLMKGDLASGQAELETVLAIRPDEPLATKLLTAVRDAQSKTTVAKAKP